MNDCEHNGFESSTVVSIAPDRSHYVLSVAVRCETCKTPFHFVGLPIGFDPKGATVSPDRFEAMLTIAPGAAPPPPAAH